MRTILLVIFAMNTFMVTVAAQAKEDVWKQLSKVSYKKEYDALMGFKVDRPVFGETVRALENKEIIIKGYIIPTDGYKSHKEFVFSAFPFSMCFFCGGAGPETVMEVEATEGIKYTVEPITIKGVLKLNDKDINRLMFKLVRAQIVKS
ncbi:MAG TPA: hypothetical protein PK611_01050 [Saprospiraceae bacterium]|nr:hypothetical protein [Saprospiraceae bacterium]HRO08815.1 hypothetical protein [Saprospiraceae bacterium]HRO72236.1 hypothetical protein [Saprospiraceae bacterium]HRP42096.1 hypothetical protein [Saprospiraceae bacterium]